MNKYVQVVRPVASGKQIVMFPFGGGSGYSYMPIINQLPRDIGVIVINPPGHMINGGTPLESIPEMAACYAKELRPLIAEGALFFGHSIGGGVAFETVKELRNTRSIRHMVISSILPPHCMTDTVEMYSHMDNEQLIQKCNDLGGLPEIFKTEPILLEGFLTGLRGDLKALEHFATTPLPKPIKLDITATVLYSDSDSVVDLTKLKQWELYLHCREFIPFKGNHFYLFDEGNLHTFARILTQQSREAE